MPTLTSSSTWAEVEAEFKTAASYFEQGSVALARRFVTACMFKLTMMPKSASHGGRQSESIETAIDHINDAMRRAEQFVSAYGGVENGGAGYIHPDFRNSWD